MKINLTGDGWLDPTTVQLQFKLQNLENKPLFLLGGPHVFFRRRRIICIGTIVEDIDQYNRIHEMFHVLSNKNNRINDDVSNQNARWDSDKVYDRLTATETNDNSATDVNNLALTNLAAGQLDLKMDGDKSKVVSTKLCSGLLNQPKWLPLRYAPITIELELVNQPTDVCITARAGLTGNWEAADISQSWSIENVEVKCDVCTLDNALDNSYVEHLLSGKNLPINYNTYISQVQALAGTNISVNVSRAVTRLKSIFVNFDKVADPADVIKKPGDVTQYIHGNFRFIKKPWNGFYHPMNGQLSQYK